MNPDVPEAHKLRGWYDEVGHNMDYSEFQGDGSQGGAGGKDCVYDVDYSWFQGGWGKVRLSAVTTQCCIHSDFV